MLIIHSTSCCDICLDEYTLARAANSPHAISCGHIFCLKCLRTLYPRTCPFCRKRFDLNRIKKLHVANEPNEEDGTKLALDLRSTILLKRVASVSGEDASDEDILEVLNDVVEWLSTQEDWSSSYQPLGVAFIALHEYRSARQALAEKTKECEDLKKELSNLEQSAVEDDGKQSNQMDIGPQIHFYHSHRRYYEFTNFSDHPVIFGGKTYPTGQHLYQSFKVSSFRKSFGGPYIVAMSSFKSTNPTLPSIFVWIAQGLMMLSWKPAAFRLKCVQIGRRWTLRKWKRRCGASSHNILTWENNCSQLATRNSSSMLVETPFGEWGKMVEVAMSLEKHLKGWERTSAAARYIIGLLSTTVCPSFLPLVPHVPCTGNPHVSFTFMAYSNMCRCHSKTCSWII